MKLAAAGTENGIFTARYEPTGDGEVTVSLRHYSKFEVCDELHTFDLKVENGKVTETVSGSFTASPSEDDMDPYFSGEWLEKDTQFTTLNVTKKAEDGWEIELASPLSHGAWVIRATAYFDCDYDAFVYADGVKYDLIPGEEVTEKEAAAADMLTNAVSDAESFKAAYGDTELPTGARYNLAQFYAANPDFYGYLEIPGTGISTPVVQGKDNKKYLRRNFFGEATKYGCPFVNYQNTYAALDYNTSIFGHNMEYDDLVFGELEKYRKIEGFKKAPVIHLETMYADYTFKVYAVFLTDSDYDSSGWYFDYIFTQLKDEQECKEYIAELDQRKLYSTGVDIQPSDKLLTLSTCAYDFSSERLVVVGRLVRDGESAKVDTSKAVANNNPRYPDKYYQKKGIANPYSNAAKWIPNA